MNNYRMNIYFSKVIKVGDKQREFNFRRLSGDSPIRYHVDVTVEKGARLIFSMYKEEAGWKISEQSLPPWLQNAQEILGRVIEEESKAIL